MIRGPETIDVVCDACGVEDELRTTEYQPLPLSNPVFRTFGIDPSTLQSEGWLVEGEKLFCPRCANMMEGRNAAYSEEG